MSEYQGTEVVIEDALGNPLVNVYLTEPFDEYPLILRYETRLFGIVHAGDGFAFAVYRELPTPYAAMVVAPLVRYDGGG